MQYFFDTVETIPEGVGFSHFSPLHIFWLLFFVLFCFGSCFLYRRLNDKNKRALELVFVGLLALDELIKLGGLLAFGNFLPKYLPLHLCSINLILIIINAIRKSETIENFLYAICIPTAIIALLFPTWTPLPLANFMHLHSSSVHILLATYPIMLTLGGTIKPKTRMIPKTLLLLLMLGAIALVFNLIFSTNFMFLMYAEPGNPLYIFKTLFGSHLVGLPILAVLVLTIMYLPVFLLERRQNKNKE